MKYKKENISEYLEYKYILLIIFSFLIIIIFIIKIKLNSSFDISLNNKEFDNEFKAYFCKIINSINSQECINTIFLNLNYFNELDEISNNNITLLIELNRTNIENLLLLIATIPFLNKNSKIVYKIKNPKTFKIMKKMFHDKHKLNNFINITKEDFNGMKDKIINFLNYKWELIYSQNILNIIRYVLNNYYEETVLQLFEQYLNLNFEYYLKTKIFSPDLLKQLMSK